MSPALRVAAGAIVLAIAASGKVSAQEPALDGRFEVGIGANRFGEVKLGSVDATLTTPSGSTRRLFSTSTALQSTAGFEARIAVRIRRDVDAEMITSYAKPTLATSLANDSENAAPATATERVQQYVVGGGVVWYLPPRIGTPRLRPFVIGNVAYVRELHETNTLAVTGRLYQVGAGVKFLLRSQPASRLKALGVRADARVAARTSGVAFDDAARYAPALAASLFVRF